MKSTADGLGHVGRGVAGLLVDLVDGLGVGAVRELAPDDGDLLVGHAPEGGATVGTVVDVLARRGVAAGRDLANVGRTGLSAAGRARASLHGTRRLLGRDRGGGAARSARVGRSRLGRGPHLGRGSRAARGGASGRRATGRGAAGGGRRARVDGAAGRVDGGAGAVIGDDTARVAGEAEAAAGAEVALASPDAGEQCQRQDPDQAEDVEGHVTAQVQSAFDRATQERVID